jgi:curved DNA-binding protein CbpA
MVDRSDAAAVLGVARNASSTEVREAYRRRIRQRHPDVAGSGSTRDATLIIEAYQVLRSPAPPEPPPARRPPPRPTEVVPDPPTAQADDAVVLIDGETMGFSFPADEVFQLLLDAAYEIGDVTYVDPIANLLEARVQFEGGPACSVVLSLQGRAERVEAFCTVESLDGSRPPPTSEVVSLLSSILAARLRRR